MPRIIATIQVRMGSNRLPGKTMCEVNGKPLLGYLLERAKQVRNIDGFVVATPHSKQNDCIEEFCSSYGVPCVRGSEDDVLDRMLQALTSQEADIGVEWFGDLPLNDPRVVEHMVNLYLEDPSYDFVGNNLRTTYPWGLEVEVFSVPALRDAASRTDDMSIREHGTLFIRLHPEIYNIKNIEAQGKLRRPDLGFGVDTEDDVKVIEAIVSHFAPRTDFSGEEIIDFLDANPDIANLNAHVHRRFLEYREDFQHV